MEVLNTTGEGEQTPTPKKANSSSISSTKDASERAASNSTGPRLQKNMPDKEGKSITAVPNYDSKKIKMQPERSNNSKEKKHHLLREGNESSKAKIAFDTISATKYKQHEIKHKEDIQQKEHVKFAPQLSSPSSVLDASLYQDELPLSPLSVSSLSKEDENIPSDQNLNTIHHHVNLQSSPSSLKTASQKSEKIDPIVHKSMAFQRSNDETPPADEIPLFPGINEQDGKYIAEMLAPNILGKEPYMNTTRQAIKPEEPFETMPKDSRQMLHKLLVFALVNEILARKKENLSPCSQHIQHKKTRAQHLFKELCSEIKCLQSSRDRSLLNENPIATTDLLQRSKAWDGFGREVPVVVSEIERLIYTDMINEIVTSAPENLQETKKKNHRKQIVT
ncbi:hypothetical protein HPP92_006050 [Vanilla planifolia]|uniref:DUF4378 domain-containing protein n=1 Tax=Vanilla planifolia TaxID=51239 RepID=A0A835VBJ0_VANPL|nr:hypothetical protein HPP92_006050 [Vanilla planifolia]